MADHQFKLVAKGASTADPNSDNLIHDLTAALSGGDGVYDFFSGNVSALHNLYQTIATSGDTVWLDGTDKNGNPVTYVDNGKHFLTVSANLHDRQTVQDGTSGDTDYKEVGSVYVTLTTDQGTSIVTLNAIHYAGIGLAGIGLTGPVFKVLKPLIKTAAKFVKNLAVKIFEKVKGGEGADDADDAEDTVEDEASGAAEDAGEAGAEVGEGIFADVTFTILDGVGIVVAIGAIAVVLILDLLKKQMTDYVRFYNVTGIDVEFGLAYTTDETGPEIAPAKKGEFLTISKIGTADAPPGVIPTDTVITRSDLTFINTNELYGIGYVLSAKPSGDFPGFRIMVSIPSTEDNIFYLGFENTDAETVWTKHENDYADPEHPRNDKITGMISSGKYSLHISTNANRGETPSPVTAEKGYNYEHLIVLTDGTVTLK